MLPETPRLPLSCRMVITPNAATRPKSTVDWHDDVRSVFTLLKASVQQHLQGPNKGNLLCHSHLSHAIPSADALGRPAFGSMISIPLSAWQSPLERVEHESCVQCRRKATQLHQSPRTTSTIFGPPYAVREPTRAGRATINHEELDGPGEITCCIVTGFKWGAIIDWSNFHHFPKDCFQHPGLPKKKIPMQMKKTPTLE